MSSQIIFSQQNIESKDSWITNGSPAIPGSFNWQEYPSQSAIGNAVVDLRSVQASSTTAVAGDRLIFQLDQGNYLLGSLFLNRTYTLDSGQVYCSYPAMNDIKRVVIKSGNNTLCDYDYGVYNKYTLARCSMPYRSKLLELAGGATPASGTFQNIIYQPWRHGTTADGNYQQHGLWLGNLNDRLTIEIQLRSNATGLHDNGNYATTGVRLYFTREDFATLRGDAESAIRQHLESPVAYLDIQTIEGSVSVANTTATNLDITALSGVLTEIEATDQLVSVVDSTTGTFDMVGSQDDITEFNLLLNSQPYLEQNNVEGVAALLSLLTSSANKNVCILGTTVIDIGASRVIDFSGNERGEDNVVLESYLSTSAFSQRQAVITHADGAAAYISFLARSLARLVRINGTLVRQQSW